MSRRCQTHMWSQFLSVPNPLPFQRQGRWRRDTGFEGTVLPAVQWTLNQSTPPGHKKMNQIQNMQLNRFMAFITRWPFVIIIGAWALCVWFSPPVVSVPPHCGRQPCTAEQLWLDWSSAAWLLWSPGQRNAGQWDWGRWELGLLWELAVPLQAQHQSVNKVLNNNTVDTGTWKNEKWNGYFLWRRGLLSSDTECGPVLSPVYWAGGSHWRCRRSRPPALTLLASTRLHQHSSHLIHVYKDKLSQDTEAAGLNDCCHCRKTNQYFMLHAKNPHISEKGGLCSMTLTQ